MSGTSRARQPIGIAQPPGQGGTDYPLIHPSDDIRFLFADLFLNYEDDAQILVPPFSIKWLNGFGTDPPVGSPPGTPVNAYDMEIQDANGNKVFSSLDSGTQFSTEAWGTRLRVIRWWQPDRRQVLNAVIHTLSGDIDGGKTYPSYFAPSSARLHARTLLRDPPRLTSVRVGLNLLEFEELTFQNGFNTEFQVGETVLTPGKRRTTSVRLDVGPGLGAGKFGPACLEPETSIRRINGVGADARGRFFLDTGGCYRISRPVLQQLSADPARSVRVRNHTLKIDNDCGPCCECDDFLAVWEAIRKLRDRYADLVSQAQQARDLYHANRERFLKQQECRLNDKLRLILEPSCPAQLGVAAGYCNNSSECVVGLVIHISFDYSDANNCPDLDGSTPLKANTTAAFSTVVCDSTFRGGFVDQSRRKNKQYVRNEFYTLGGDWPHFWAYFPFVDPGGMAYVTFRLAFDNPTTEDVVEAVADAFQVGSQALVQGGSPVQGYVPGSGCTGSFCQDPEVHLVDCPVKETSMLIPNCCEESISLSIA